MIEFRIKHDPKHLEETGNDDYIKDNFFIFKTEYKDYDQIKAQDACAISKLVQKIINSDKNSMEYCLKKDVYDQNFLDSFFDSISKKEKINIDEKNIRNFIEITNELEIEYTNQSDRTACLSFLCNLISSQSFTNDEEKFHYLRQNIIKIDSNILKTMPTNVTQELISKSEFSNENDHIQFLINNKSIIDHNIFDSIDFDKITKESLSEILSNFEFDEKSSIKDKIFQRMKKELLKNKISVLYLTLRVEQRVNLNFLTELNNDESNKNFQIQCKTIFDDELVKILKHDKDYLNFFDLIIIGGVNSFSEYPTMITHQVIEKFKEFHNNDGIFLFLHDVIYANFALLLEPFAHFLGYQSYNEKVVFDEVEYEEKSGKVDIISYPFNVGSKFKVAPTHQEQKFDPKYTVMKTSFHQKNYYTENLDENVADCDIGHTPNILESEKKFFYNVICHLYRSSRNRHVKTRFIIKDI